MKIITKSSRDADDREYVSLDEIGDADVVVKHLGCIVNAESPLVAVWKPNGLQRSGPDLRLEDLKKIVEIMEMTPEDRKEKEQGDLGRQQRSDTPSN